MEILAYVLLALIAMRFLVKSIVFEQQKVCLDNVHTDAFIESPMKDTFVKNINRVVKKPHIVRIRNSIRKQEEGLI